ncbi:MAG: hypothetical protein CVU50_09640 [Candidatus Cloacimonetes bacterium HGW-Cloacimonetes-3]|jgi:hypothetical protein|nr:MAG: hypothetical protein CVU50_09640 [Candidatus Cloacimonetes bacterium HGW-Cloacimonetes-3]
MKLNRLLFTLIAVLTISAANAEPWDLKCDVNFNLSQSAYSSNWAGSAVGSITWITSASMSAEKAISPMFYNINTLNMAIGQTHQQREGTDAQGNKTHYWARPDKSTDRLDIESLMKMTMESYVNPFAAVRLESQFIDQSDPTLTKILNPMKFTESLGATRNFLDNDPEMLTGRFGLALRQNLNRDVMVTAIPVSRESKVTVDGGLEFVANYKNVYEPANLIFNSKLQLYQAVFNNKSDEISDDWKSPDMNWENTLTLKLIKAVSLNFYMQLKYEKEEISELQFKETMGLGLSYNLF